MPGSSTRSSNGGAERPKALRSRRACPTRERRSPYLTGHGASIAPERVILVRSTNAALHLVLSILGDGEGEVLVPAPHRPSIQADSPVRLKPYGLTFEGRWRLDRRSIQRAITPRTRAIVVGNPADPTGAELSRDELMFLEGLCKEHGLALVGEESFLDSSLDPGPSVATVARCLAFHVSGLGGVCGLARLEAEWLAVAGPEALAGPAAARLVSLVDLEGSGSRPGVLLVPALLGRRETFLARLRARLTRNRSALATASLREAPWTLQWGGGCWAVLQINPAQDEEELCLALLEEGVALQPGYLGGFPREGYLLVSLLPRMDIFEAALGRLEARLRRPVLP